MRRRTSLVLSAMLAVLSTALIVMPALADTTFHTTSWDNSSGLRVTPGTMTQVATLTVAEEAGASCTIEVRATNGQSQHPGNNLVVELSGVPVLVLTAVEDEPYTTKSGSVGIQVSGAGVLMVYLESTSAYRTSTSGSLDLACVNQPTTTTEPPGSTTTTEPPATTTTQPPGSTTTTTEPPGSTTTQPPGSTTSTTQPQITTTTTGDPGDPGDPDDPDDPGTPPPTGSTPPAPGSHEEPGNELTALYGLVGILGLVGSTVLIHNGRTGR